jgi:hypothetical protein
MQTLSEFRAQWHPLIVRQAKDVAERIEAAMTCRASLN